MNDSEVEKDSGEFTRVSPLKKMMRALTILFQLASINDFYYFLGRRHSVYINIVPHKALTSVLISKSLAELAAEDSKLDGALLSKEHTLYLSFLGPNKPTLIFT